MIGLFQQFPKQFLGSVKQAGPQIILAKFQQGPAPLIGRQGGPGNQAAMNMDRSIHLAAAPE